MVLGAYRTPAQVPIHDGACQDFTQMLSAISEASSRLGEPIRSADDTKALLVAFEVGPYRWTIRSRLAVKTCPPRLRQYLRTKVGREALAFILTWGTEQRGLEKS